MKTSGRILLIVVGLLLLADISERSLFWLHYHSSLSKDFSNATASLTNTITGNPLLVMVGHSNSVDGAIDGIVIRKDKTSELLWTESDFDHDGKPDEASYFFHGTNMFNLFLMEGHPPEYGVIFYGTEKSKVTWLDKGSGSFIERIFDDTNGVFSRVEVWYNETWRPIENRNGNRVIVINGQSLRLTLTNGVWTSVSTNNQPSQ